LLGDWLKERRFNVVLLSSFAMIAVLLSAIGMYGLISFSMEQRVGELGIRRALGGQTPDVLRMVLKEGATLAGAGVVLGIVGAWVLTRFLAGMLFGVEPTDWPTFGLLAAVLMISSLATLVPAIRATRVDPMEALRDG
jgi:putative ABC transport system permease protein